MMCFAISRRCSLRALQNLTQVLFGALRCCRLLDLKGCTQLDGSAFAALAGTAATLTALNCQHIGTVGSYLSSLSSASLPARVRRSYCMCLCHTAADVVLAVTVVSRHVGVQSGCMVEADTVVVWGPSTRRVTPETLC